MFKEIYDWIVQLESSTYTVVQTVIYALLVILGLYLLYKWLKKIGIAIDTRLIISSITYIIFGGILRVIEDTNMVPDPWWILFITPQVYILTLIFAGAVLFISYLLEKKKIVDTYVKPYAGTGILCCVVSFLILCIFGIMTGNFNGIDGLIVVGAAAAALLGIWALLRYVFKWEYASHPMYIALLASHMLDASATSFAISFRGYYEQHVLGGALIELTGTPYIMFALKVAVLIPAVWILEKFRKESGMEAFWYLVILAMIVVGLGPGIRDLLRMVLCI